MMDRKTIRKAKQWTYMAARRAGKRMPKWADQKAILDIYMMKAGLVCLIGCDVQVDHIYPLRGALVSGLHVANNLDVITTRENRRKSNKIV